MSSCGWIDFESWWDARGRWKHGPLYAKLRETYAYMNSPIVEAVTVGPNGGRLRGKYPQGKPQNAKATEMGVSAHALRSYIRILWEAGFYWKSKSENDVDAV